YYASPQVTNGIDSVRFDPSQTVTRGQCATFLWRAMGCPEPGTTETSFVDIKADEYWYRPILWAVEEGITKGTDAAHFSPWQTCSTAHIITLLYRTLDIGADGWYQEAADWAEKEKLLQGTGLDVQPEVKCPRGAVVTFLYRELGSGETGAVNRLGKNDFLLYVEDYYNYSGKGRFINGRVVNGSVGVGDEIMLLSHDEKTMAPKSGSYTVMDIEAGGKSVARANTGDRVSILISDDTRIKTPWGSAIVNSESGLQNITGRFEGRLDLNDVSMSPLKKGDTLQVKYPGGDVTAMLVYLNGEDIPPDHSREGAVLTLAYPVVWYVGQTLSIQADGRTCGTFTVTAVK
ncbi:MAG: S-layer homology domain-containing protein, partial [Oscillospiraceae bacterium]|nr:S-layer homology domain-containing protein [Oscillospiraceae bacterium]